MFNFQLTLDEANLVLTALGKAPFDQVATLIGNIRQQAQPQLERVQAEMDAAKIADADQEPGQETA